MKRKTGVWFSIAWLILVTLPVIIVAANLKFPAFDHQRYGQILIPIFLILPLLSLVYNLVAYRAEKTYKVVDILLISIFVIEMICTAVCTFGFKYYYNDLYPLVSATTDPSNYLVIENRFEETDIEYVKTVFPEKIPEEATNVKYNYRCAALGIYDIEAQWKLPYEKYMAERDKYIPRSSKSENSDSIYEYDFEFDNDIFVAKISFDDSQCIVRYSFGTIL